MKKRFLALLLCAAAVVNTAGCGNSTGSVEGTETVQNQTAQTSNLSKYDLKGLDYVTLCDYNAIDVELTETYDVSDDDVTAYLEYMFAYAGPFYTADETKTTVQEGDIVNVDYVGKLDGVAFANGSAQNQNIDVSNNSSPGGGSFIEGFSDALLGASVGDVIDADVTFPEDYSLNADLAGKAVVFTFTVNSIQKEVTIDTMDDAFAAETFGAENVQGIYDQIETYLQASAQSNRRSAIFTVLENHLTENCQVEIPQDYKTDVLSAVENDFITRYCDGDETQMESVAEAAGYTMEELRQQWEQSIESSIELELIIRAVAEQEKIEIDETEFTTYVNNIVTNYGYGSTETLYENSGYGDIAYGESQVRMIYLANLVLEDLSEKANISVTEPDNAQTEESTEETVVSGEENTESTEQTQTEEPEETTEIPSEE